jgi:predicted nucleic acid-binding protein
MLLDTSGLLAFFDAGAKQYNDAVTYFYSALHRLVHSYIIAEFIPLATVRGHPRAPVLDFVDKLQQNPLVEVVYVDEALHQSALEFLRKRLDKTWSLCDAVSFLLMQQRDITEALTTDHHFEQAGFVRLLHP